jgi:hypothetical protein
MWRLKLMFEWGGGCIWGDDPRTIDRLGVGPLEDQLALGDVLREKLTTMSTWHDGALNWSNPSGASPWAKEEFEKFDQAAQELLREIQVALGTHFSIRYDVLGVP